MKILTIIGSYIKTHIITTAVVGIVVVGGAIATPIIINNINDNQSKTETEIREPNKKDEVENKTCDEGYELVDNECIIKQEVQEEPKENENTNNENTTNTNKPNTDTSITKPNNNKPSTNKPNTTKPQENKPQETKPTCNDISCKITESNRVVYYNGKMLFGIKVYTPEGWGNTHNGWIYDSSLIQSLSREDRNYIFNNYFKKETYCSTGKGTATDCLRYSTFERDLDKDFGSTLDGEVLIYENSLSFITPCVAYIQNGTIPNGYDKNTLDGNCHQRDTDTFKWTVVDAQNEINRVKEVIRLHKKAKAEAMAYKQAYQTTRSLLQK